MGEVILFPIILDSDQGHEFVADLTRHCENLLSEEVIKARYNISDSVWAHLGDDALLVKAVEEEKVRRVRDGSSARERAQQHFATAPNVLNEILHGDNVSPRHKIDSVHALRVIAATGAETAAATRFIIKIDLGDGHVENFNKSICVDADDVDPGVSDDVNDTDTTPQGVLAAITAKKKGEGDGGQHL